MQKVADVLHIRDNCPEEYKFVPMGRLLFDEDKERCVLFMESMRQGWVYAFPKVGAEFPYLQGELLVLLGKYKDAEGKEKRRKVKIGRIATSDDESGKVRYEIEIFCMPTLSHRYGQTGVWVQILEDDYAGRDTTAQQGA